GRVALLQPAATREQIVSGCAGMVSITDRERVRDCTGTGSRLAIGESALICVYMIRKPKVVQIADQARTGARSEDLNRAIADMPIDQLMMKHLEERLTERVRLPAALPSGNVQFLQSGKKFVRLGRIGRAV